MFLFLIIRASGTSPGCGGRANRRGAGHPRRTAGMVGGVPGVGMGV